MAFVAASLCPNCGDMLDAATHTSGDFSVQPSMGDASMCLNCGAILIFDKNMQLRRAVDADLDRFEPAELAKLATLRLLRPMVVPPSGLRRNEAKH